MSLRVLHLTRDFPPRVNGGLSTAVGSMVLASRDLGLEVQVISFDGWRPRGRNRAARLPDTDDVFRVRENEDLAEARCFAERFAPDILHAHDALVLEALPLDALPLPAPLVFSVHVDHALQRRLRGLDRPTRSEEAQARAIERADAVTAPSRTCCTAVHDEAPGAHVVFAPLGVDASPDSAGGEEILYVGRLADVKGTRELLEAARRVDAPFVIAGGLPDNQRAELRWHENAPENVLFAGWLDRESLAARHRTAAMLVAPSWTETFGLAVAEAMRAGVPPIVSDVGALPERVKHGVSGLLIPPRDVDALVAAIERLRADPELRATLGAGARDAARAWTWSACADVMLEVYRSIPELRPPRGV